MLVIHTRTSVSQVVKVPSDKLRLSELLVRKGQSKAQSLGVIILLKIPVNCVAIDLAADLYTGLSLKCLSLHMSDFPKFYDSQLPIKKINGNLAQLVNNKIKLLACV